MSDRGRIPSRVDISHYESPLSLANRVARVLWGGVWLLLFRPTPRRLFGWRVFLLRCFGAKLGRGVRVYPSTIVWAPWNLEMGDHSALGNRVDCYCVDKVRIGSHVTVSQHAYLCAASHDIEDPGMRLVLAPIVVGDGAWVCAGAFVGPGVTVGEGAVVGARAVVVKDVEPWAVVAGNPARFIRKRELKRADP